MLGLSDATARTAAFASLLSGNVDGVPAFASSWATPYALSIYGSEMAPNGAGPRGYGYGDGRAISIGEVVVGGRRSELQLKGAGTTPFCRNADGRAVLRSSTRDFWRRKRCTTCACRRRARWPSSPPGSTRCSGHGMHRTRRAPCRAATRRAQRRAPRGATRASASATSASCASGARRPAAAATTPTSTAATSTAPSAARSRRASPRRVRASGTLSCTGAAPKRARRARWVTSRRSHGTCSSAILPTSTTRTRCCSDGSSRWRSVGGAAALDGGRVDSRGYVQSNFNADNLLGQRRDRRLWPIRLHRSVRPDLAMWVGPARLTHFSFLNQHVAAGKNFAQFAKSLEPLLDTAGTRALRGIVRGYDARADAALAQMWRRKLGLAVWDSDASALLRELDRLLQLVPTDYTIFFRQLSAAAAEAEAEAEAAMAEAALEAVRPAFHGRDRTRRRGCGGSGGGSRRCARRASRRPRPARRCSPRTRSLCRASGCSPRRTTRRRRAATRRSGCSSSCSGGHTTSRRRTRRVLPAGAARGAQPGRHRLMS